MVKNSQIESLACILLLLAAGQHTALAASATAAGPAALALAAVVAERAPLARYEKRVLARLFEGNTSLRFLPKDKISVTAASIVCRASNVDITARSCDLTFRTNKSIVRARQANELYATMAVAGVTAEGAAGSLVESVSKLDCTIDPQMIMQKAGGGADCTFETGQ
jgi:hypothetical protein